jgi:alpha-mannosidase
MAGSGTGFFVAAVPNRQFSRVGDAASGGVARGMTYNTTEGLSAMIFSLKLRFPIVAFSCCLGTALIALPVLGQHGKPVPQPGDNLPAASRAVINRLESLSQLPAGAWKMHTGDLTHGEEVNLDDGGWQTVEAGAKTSMDAEWFRQTFQIPDTLHGYDLTGARVWFQFHANANGPMPEILYFNGRRVAMGDDLEPIVLFDQARPGDKVVVAVKLLATVDVKQFRGATLRIDFPESRPNPEDLAQEFLTAAVLVPSLGPGDASKMETLNNAIGAVDVSALDAAQSASGDALAQDEAKFDASLKAAHGKLEVLRPLLETATYHETGNAHIDAAWLWPWTETVDVVKRTFSTALQLMDEYPGYTYTQSAAVYYEWMADKYPDINAQIKKRIQEGRWEVVGGMWVEPDLNMPSGESLVRQILVAKRWFKQEYGVDVRIGWNPDSFGYSWQLPQIYKKSGIDYFVTQKMTWNDTNQLPFKLFWWESPDGSKVLTYFPHDYVNTTLNPVRLASDLAVARDRSPGMTDMMDLYGVGDHGGGPTRAMLDEGFHWKDPSAAAVAADGGAPVTPKYEFGTAQSYFSTVGKEIAPDSRTWNYESIAKGYQAPTEVAGKISIPTWDTEMYLEYHRGVYTTQAMHKHNMRTSEEELLNAEKWSSLAWLDGKSYPDAQLTEDWKKVLFNQFHDLAAGSGIADIYKDARQDYQWVRMSTDEISSSALTTVAEHIDTRGNGTPVLVYNPVGWQRSGDFKVDVQLPSAAVKAVMVVDASGKNPQAPIRSAIDEKTGVAHLTLHVANVPAMGYKLLRVMPNTGGVVLAKTAQETGDAIHLNESGIYLTVDKKSGCITEIVQDGFKPVAPGACGNQLQFFKDLPKQYDAWNIDPGTLDVPPSVIEKADSVELIGADSPRPAIRVTSHWQNSKFVQTISLKGDIVDIENDIDWHEQHILLKAAFPLAVTSNFATYEIPYGSIERPTTRNNSWEKAQFEVPALRWADLSGKGPDGKVYGLSLLNKDKYGYDAAGNVLRLTLLRSPTWPDPDADQGHQHFHYAIYPHAGTWKDALTVRHGWEYDYPLQAVVTTAHAGSLPPEHSFASVGPDNVVLSAVKKAEDANGLIFRAYEWAGKQATAEFHVPPGATSATVTNLMEHPEGDPLPVENNVVKVPIHPYEILTIRVDYPKTGTEGSREQGK